MPGKIEFFKNCMKKVKFSKICLENRTLFYPDPRPPDFKPHYRRRVRRRGDARNLMTGGGGQFLFSQL